MLKYVNECKNQTVRKNVSIPSWLNEMAKKKELIDKFRTKKCKYIF